MIEKIKGKILQQIKDKKKEKNQRIKYQEIKLIDDDKVNLYCKKCIRNCHINCRCWRIAFWDPVWVCDSMKSSECLACEHHADNHERTKKIYKTYDRERSVSPAKKKILDSEISKLEESLKNITKIERSQQSVLESKKQIEENKNKKCQLITMPWESKMM